MPRSRTSAIARTIAVVALLGLAGGVLGGVLTGVLFSGIVFVNGGWHDFSLRTLGSIIAFASGFGAAYGVVLGPLLGWTLMRRVPLGRAIGETALLAACGVEIAMVNVLPMPFGVLWLPVVLAGAGALRLRYVYREKAGPVVGLSSGH
ncbi:MAG: hypothetical protein IT357_06675 [Gemmatimonadaceae bacterium]|nr:hypothetical protein [Gemmatimonadaceae bacterium]